jgi:hypothetical protein
MHPEFARNLAEQRWAELQRSAASGRRQALPTPADGWRWLRRALWRRGSGGRLPQPGRLPGVFLDGPEAFGLRTYLTDDEAQQLLRQWAKLVSQFADRTDEPARRPPDAVLFEVVVLGRRVPEMAGSAPGLPGSG